MTTTARRLPAATTIPAGMRKALLRAVSDPGSGRGWNAVEGFHDEGGNVTMTITRVLCGCAQERMVTGANAAELAGLRAQLAEWPCEAYGPEGAAFGAVCFFADELGQRVCGTEEVCRTSPVRLVITRREDSHRVARVVGMARLSDAYEPVTVAEADITASGLVSGLAGAAAAVAGASLHVLGAGQLNMYVIGCGIGIAAGSVLYAAKRQYYEGG